MTHLVIELLLAAIMAAILQRVLRPGELDRYWRSWLGAFGRKRLRIVFALGTLSGPAGVGIAYVFGLSGSPAAGLVKGLGGFAICGGSAWINGATGGNQFDAALKMLSLGKAWVLADIESETVHAVNTWALTLSADQSRNVLNSFLGDKELTRTELPYYETCRDRGVAWANSDDPNIHSQGTGILRAVAGQLVVRLKVRLDQATLATTG